MYTLLLVFYFHGTLYHSIEKVELTKQECFNYVSSNYIKYPMEASSLNCVETITLEK